MHVSNVLHAARWKCRTQKIAMGTIAQLCQAISPKLTRISTIGKNLLNSIVSPTCHHNMVNFGPLDPLASLGHRSTFQLASRLGSVTARHSSSGRQPNFAAFNRGRHLYSVGRPSRWALAHISSITFFVEEKTLGST